MYVRFFINDSKISGAPVQIHLQRNTCKNKAYCITFKDYKDILDELQKLGAEAGAKIWVRMISLLLARNASTS